MSGSTSSGTGKPYGIELTCLIGEFPRSSYYAIKTSRQSLGDEAGIFHACRPVQSKRGPKTSISDHELLVLIHEDLDNSPFVGEGHRKVHARLRFQNVLVGKNRVLRLMRMHNLLSPHRRPYVEENEHNGTIITQNPGEIWATDGSLVTTVDFGKVWIFAAVEHWNAECVGWHVSKLGSRFEALQPLAMGLSEHYGSTDMDAARGLALRMDHGCQYTSDDFLSQVRAWGISPSFAFVGQPETNGVAERFFRTLKEQAIYGRVFKGVEDVRKAVGDFVEKYNAHWRLKKNGYLTPAEMRMQHDLEMAA